MSKCIQVIEKVAVRFATHTFAISQASMSPIHTFKLIFQCAGMVGPVRVILFFVRCIIGMAVQLELHGRSGTNSLPAGFSEKPVRYERYERGGGGRGVGIRKLKLIVLLLPLRVSDANNDSEDSLGQSFT
jgi:hypothetical protein